MLDRRVHFHIGSVKAHIDQSEPNKQLVHLISVYFGVAAKSRLNSMFRGLYYHLPSRDVAHKLTLLIMEP